MKKKYMKIIFIVLFIAIIVFIIIFLVLKYLVKKKKSDGIKDLCNLVTLSLLTLQNQIVSAFDPSKSTGDVVLTIYKHSFVIIPYEDLTINDIDTIGFLDGYSCDPVLSILNYKSTWDHIYLSYDVQMDETQPFVPFHIFDTSHKYVVVKSAGSPACDNVFAEIYNINIGDFIINSFSSTLNLVALDSPTPTCTPLDNNKIQVHWNLSARSTPFIEAHMSCSVNVWSGYCGMTSSFKCKHDRKNSPCPNNKIKLDTGTVAANISITSSIYFNFHLIFEISVDIFNKMLHIKNMSIILNEWDVSNSITFDVSHDGFKLVGKFIKIGDLIDTTPFEKAIKNNVEAVLDKSVPDIFNTINEYLKKQDISIPLSSL